MASMVMDNFSFIQIAGDGVFAFVITNDYG
jgi:hypothetical protein